MERERKFAPLPEVPFYDNEDYAAPEATKEDIEKLLREIEELKAAAPKPAFPEHVQRKNGIEIADMEFTTLLVSLDPKDESSVIIPKDFAEERVMENRAAAIEFAPEKQQDRHVGFRITPEGVKRYERQEFDRSGIEPTEDLEEWLENAAPHVAEHLVREEEAKAFRETTGMDFVSRRTAEQLLAVIRRYKERLHHTFFV